MDSTRPTEADRRLWMGMARLVSYVAQQADRMLVLQHDLHLSEMTLLGQVTALDGEARMVDLAHHLQCSRAAVTKLVDALEKQGLLQRQADNEDRRVTRVFVTAPGRERLRQANLTFEQVVTERFWSRLSPTEAEQMASVLTRVEGDLGIVRGGVLPP
ncbi:MAG TPA: MarR family transcriptional regulator [Ornithinimicrobium sp.]|uniref:MarR family winged helix-turn-helix transcriptional regulator n=1 Tax=Ornithinimicrobium sp. TaxID=1977084 RepID=UPI002B463590|nr:MarR family transcriptional regulator [Ornithinimicrobium sp.]HKJ11201.1 MarR family transcriptional regulator [Ornithinimicrobium sp.]